MLEGELYSYLRRFGYLPLTINPASQPETVSAAIVRMQGDLGLKMDGIAGRITERAMLAPRCGVSEEELQRARGQVCKWNHAGPVRWTVKNFLTVAGLAVDEQRAIYRQAFRHWEKVCAITFAEVATVSEAHIVLDVGRGPRSDFDGAGGTLAWAQLPCGASQVLVRFDLDEPFGLSATLGRVALGPVATHEIGHAIGLSHIAKGQGTALMNPVYDPRVPEPLALDIRAVIALYGPAAIPPKVPVPVPAPAPLPGGEDLGPGQVPPPVKPRADSIELYRAGRLLYRELI